MQGGEHTCNIDDDISTRAFSAQVISDKIYVTSGAVEVRRGREEERVVHDGGGTGGNLSDRRHRY